jgi:hypothetical protein
MKQSTSKIIPTLQLDDRQKTVHANQIAAVLLLLIFINLIPQ